jgi:hypothetical protein
VETLEALLPRVERLEKNLEYALRAASGAGAVLAGGFTFVSSTPFAVSASGLKLAVNTTSAPIRLNLPALPNLALLLVTAIGGSNPIVIAPASGTIWDPSASAFGATATLTNGAGGANGWWQYDAPNNRFIELV